MNDTGDFERGLRKDTNLFTFAITKAGVAQLVERQLPKLQAAGSRPVSRSNQKPREV
jgi:hypothetical protein